jgi:hypothetical protein
VSFLQVTRLRSSYTNFRTLPPGRVTNASTQLNVYPSIDLLRFRILPIDIYRWHVLNKSPLQDFYFGIHFSFLDPLGPVVEGATSDISLRNSANQATVLWMSFLVPRLDFEVGLPSISKNLTVGAGTALRFFRAEGVPGNAIYCAFGANCSFNGNQEGSGLKPSNLEGSVFVKFVP